VKTTGLKHWMLCAGFFPVTENPSSRSSCMHRGKMKVVPKRKSFGVSVVGQCSVIDADVSLSDVP
jgi:hypothetical protein